LSREQIDEVGLPHLFRIDIERVYYSGRPSADISAPPK
jgi:hypothetical protein